MLQNATVPSVASHSERSSRTARHAPLSATPAGSTTPLAGTLGKRSAARKPAVDSAVSTQPATHT